jgi:hypothetical protein
VLTEAEREIGILGGTFGILGPTTDEVARFQAGNTHVVTPRLGVPSRGWGFLISAPDEVAVEAFASLLDARLEGSEEAGS